MGWEQPPATWEAPTCLGLTWKDPGEWPEERVTRAWPRCLSLLCAAPQPAVQSPRHCSVLGDAEAAQQPPLSVRRNQCHFCPLVLFPCCEAPYGSGQKELQKKLAGCREHLEKHGAGLAWG